MISSLKSRKDPMLPLSFRPLSLLDTTGKLLEKILLTRNLNEVRRQGLLHDEQFGFRPKHRTLLQLPHLVERVTRDFGENSQTGSVFLDVAKAFDTAWVDSLVY
jgi:hypothetical protein